MKTATSQKTRGTRADAETVDKIYIIKNVSELRATYQIRLLLFKAVKHNKQLVFIVPEKCTFLPDLKDLISSHEDNVTVEKR